MAGSNKVTNYTGEDDDAMAQISEPRADKLGADYADLDPAVGHDLVAANRILAEHGVLDSFGHVSVRDPRDSGCYLQMQAIAPRDVTVDDLITFDLDSHALNANGRPVYRERFIHGMIYQARPDVNAVVHSHSPTVIPFSVTEKPLRAIFHNGHFLGQGVPVWEIREHVGENNNMLVLSNELGRSLAEALGTGSVVLMRGHGNAVAGPDLKTTVFRAVYTEINAKLQMQAAMLGGPVNFLNEFEMLKKQNVDRPWATWKREVGIP
jgi:HCOMODA/2-hydroxy-3-carboxy-muconic semialdehyde decarboxylase